MATLRRLRATGTFSPAGAAAAAAVLGLLVTTRAGAQEIGETSSTPTCASRCVVAHRDADHPARRPFQHEFRFTTPDGSAEFTDGFVVPAGTRLVIEHVSGAATPPDGQLIRKFSLTTTAAGEFAFHSVPVTPNGFGDFVAGQTTRIYADGGTAVGLSAPRSAGGGSFLTVVTVSGHLVDVP